MGERATAAGELFRWRPAGVGRRGVPCARCDGKRTPVRLLDNLLEALCATCGRSLALERFRAIEKEEGKAELLRRLQATGALDAADAAPGPDGAAPGVDLLVERGALRRDLRLVLDLDGEAGAFAYDASPLKDLVLPEEVERALDDRRERGGVLPELLRERVLERLGATLRSVGGEQGIDALTDPDAIDPACRRALPARALEVFRAVPVRREDGALVVAMWDPLDDALVADLESLVGGPVHAILAEPDTLRRALQSLGVAAPSPASDEGGAVEGEVEAPEGHEPPVDDELHPFEAILLEALEEGASEVLVEPRPGGASLRFRVGGELRKERALSPDVPSAFVDRLEGGKPAVEGKARVGRARCEVSGLPVAFEYRVLSTALGPAVAITLDADQDEEAVAPGLSQLGLGLDALAAFEAALARGTGIIVVAAPPRGGKSAAYQAVLERAQRLGGSIISLERRPRRALAGVVQVELDPAREGDLDALLRPAPDWLGLDGPLEGGPLRLATDVALAGGGVVLTVTAPDARSALARLRLAGLPADLIAAQVRVVLARRVCPRVCSRCRVERQPQKRKPTRRLSFDPGALGDLSPSVGLGCPACADQGTSGTVALAELCRPSADGAGVEQVRGSTAIATRARELLRAGDVPVEAVSDLL